MILEQSTPIPTLPKISYNNHPKTKTYPHNKSHHNDKKLPASVPDHQATSQSTTPTSQTRPVQSTKNPFLPSPNNSNPSNTAINCFLKWPNT
jgi:hypothetical protein